MLQALQAENAQIASPNSFGVYTIKREVAEKAYAFDASIAIFIGADRDLVWTQEDVRVAFVFPVDRHLSALGKVIAVLRSV